MSLNIERKVSLSDNLFFFSPLISSYFFCSWTVWGALLNRLSRFFSFIQIIFLSSAHLINLKLEIGEINKIWNENLQKKRKNLWLYLTLKFIVSWRVVTFSIIFYWLAKTDFYCSHVHFWQMNKILKKFL